MLSHHEQEVYSLSSREKQVLYFLVRGFTAKMISHKLIISQRTVEHHLKNIKYKTGVYSKPRLIEVFFDKFKEQCAGFLE